MLTATSRTRGRSLSRMTFRRAVVAAVVSLTAASAVVVLASPAQAGVPGDPTPPAPAQVWFQSFQRPTFDAPCVVPKELEIEWLSSWDQSENHWSKSWEWWPNAGTGGWTCSRSITWAPGGPVILSVG